jgi:plasmid rolling circle replication initiator protein Rep
MKNIVQITRDVKRRLLPVTAKEFEKRSKRKKGAEILAFAYGKTNLPEREKKAVKLRLCGKTIGYSEDPHDEKYVLVSVIRCSLRLCPSCSWKRAKQVFQNVYRIITDKEFSEKRFIFLTLTVKNCGGGSLESEIGRLLSAWQKLTANERQAFRRSFAGTFRALEVTYNPLKKKYHPHLHAMAAVDPGYFKKSNPDYISQAGLRELWRKACGLNYPPHCWIERVWNSTKKQVAEVAKYTVKSADYLSRPEVVQVLDPALRNKRLVAYGGLFKTVKAKLNLPDEDDPDGLPRVTVEELLNNPYIQKIIFRWEMGRYHVSLMEPSADPADWLEPGRLVAEFLRRSATGRGQGA